MRVLSGMQPTGNGELHIGNYLGAAKQWIELQNDHDAFYMIVNLHAITVPYQPEILRDNVFKLAAIYLALGLDPAKATIFVQSLVPEHAEMTWLLNCVTTMGELRRMTQFKDKTGDNQEAGSVGLFDYPVLMAADILLYRANLVPVGDDQKQHLELTRDLAERFNSRFKASLIIPEPLIPENLARIMALDNPTKKMSKSGAPDSFISLLDSADKIREKMKVAVTDSENVVRFDRENKPAISNLLTIFSAISGQSVEALASTYGSGGYGHFKADLAEVLINFLSPVQARYQTFYDDQAQLEQILRAGSAKAQNEAAATLATAKTQMGLL